MTRTCWGCQVRPHEADKCERLSGGFKTWQQHHLLPQAVIRRECHGGYRNVIVGGPTRFVPNEPVSPWGPSYEPRSVESLLADERNMVWMREWHHMALEGRVTSRMYWEWVPAPAIEFASELGLTSRLKRLYPSVLDVVSGAVPSTVPEFEEALRLLSELAVTPASDIESGDTEERWSP